MEDIFIDLGDSVGISEGSVFLSGDENLLSESETLVGPPGPAGPPGQPGKDGKDGISPSVSVGTTTTTAPGTNAVVTNSGTTQDLILDFSIPRGATGETGPAGSDGLDGSDGYSPTAIVTQTASGSTITITDANGTTSADVYNGYSPIANVVKVGDTATITITDENGTTTASVSDGQDGTPGTPGQAATISVGSTTTGSAGTNASVTNSGSSSAAVFDFVIPRGDTGAAGQDGRDGADGQAATIAVGNVTTGAAGSSATVTNTGTSSAAVFDFSIPQGVAGQNGQDGRDGSDGAAATIAVGTTTTGNAGTNASVTNSGTSSAAVFNFVIPRGADGQNGQNGQDGAAATVSVGTTTTGAAGTNASVTNSGTSSAAVLNFTIPRGADGVTPDTSVTTYSLSNLPAHSGGTNGYFIRKQLSVVTMNIDVIWMNSVTANSWTSIGTLPSAILPTATFTFPCVFTNGNTGQVFASGKVNVQTNGNIRFQSPTALNNLAAISFSTSWII